MNPLILLSSLFSLFFTATAIAQNHTDCASAILLDNQDIVTIDSTDGIGIDENFAGICLSQEFASTWFSWEIDQPGQLTFVLTPLNPIDDLDFAVFKLNQDGDCAEKVLERCMAAGENLGDPTGSIPCMGTTGLNLIETDVEEQPGCNNGNNNFLAALTCNHGDKFALVVNNFSQSNQGFTLEWGGTASFVTTTTTHEKSELDVFVGPNPTNGILNISVNKPIENRYYRIVNNLGRTVGQGKIITENMQLDVSELPVGLYVLVVELKEGWLSYKVVVE